MKTIQEILSFGKNDLLEVGIETARIDAEILLGHILNVGRAFLYAWPKKIISDKEIEIFYQLLRRRKTREPIAYIIGIKEFFGYEFTVNHHVLIPRPDTEKLVEMALLALPIDKPATVIDVCTGSGCISIALALQRPKASIVAIDISADALQVASCNVKRHQVNQQISLKKGDLLLPYQGQLSCVDLIIANPPYIKAEAMQTLMPDVRDFEPHLALLGDGESGLLHHKRIVEAGIPLLKLGGQMILEIGYDQKPEIENWTFSQLQLPRFIRDDAGSYRIVCYKK